MKRIHTVTGITLAVLLSCCAPTLYIPTNAHVSTDATLEELKTGRDLYVQKCSSCHNLYLPTDYRADRWKGILDTMQVKARISEQQKVAINKYLLAGLRGQK
jgi:hypothetical protein